MLSNELIFKMRRRFLLLQPGTNLFGFAVVTIIPIIFFLWHFVRSAAALWNDCDGWSRSKGNMNHPFESRKSKMLLNPPQYSSVGEKYRSRNVIILSPSVAKVKVSHVQLSPCIILVSLVTCQDRVTVTYGSCFLTWLDLTWSVMAAECKAGKTSANYHH